MSHHNLQQALEKLADARTKQASLEDSPEGSLLQGMIKTREECRAFEDNLFQDGLKTRKAERKLVGDLFVQAGAVVSGDPMFSKTAAVDRYFDEKRYLTEAQKRFPELLDVVR